MTRSKTKAPEVPTDAPAPRLFPDAPEAWKPSRDTRDRVKRRAEELEDAGMVWLDAWKQARNEEAELHVTKVEITAAQLRCLLEGAIASGVLPADSDAAADLVRKLHPSPSRAELAKEARNRELRKELQRRIATQQADKKRRRAELEDLAHQRRRFSGMPLEQRLSALREEHSLMTGRGATASARDRLLSACRVALAAAKLCESNGEEDTAEAHFHTFDSLTHKRLDLRKQCLAEWEGPGAQPGPAKPSPTAQGMVSSSQAAVEAATERVAVEADEEARRAAAE